MSAITNEPKSASGQISEMEEKQTGNDSQGRTWSKEIPEKSETVVQKVDTEYREQQSGQDKVAHTCKCCHSIGEKD